MRKNIVAIALLMVVVLSGGCDVPWQAIGTIATAASNGDGAALLVLGTQWLEDRQDDGDDSQAWYCWPVCDWFN